MEGFSWKRRHPPPSCGHYIYRIYRRQSRRADGYPRAIIRVGIQHAKGFLAGPVSDLGNSKAVCARLGDVDLPADRRRRADRARRRRRVDRGECRERFEQLGTNRHNPFYRPYARRGICDLPSSSGGNRRTRIVAGNPAFFFQPRTITGCNRRPGNKKRPERNPGIGCLHGWNVLLRGEGRERCLAEIGRKKPWLNQRLW